MYSKIQDKDIFLFMTEDFYNELCDHSLFIDLQFKVSMSESLNKKIDSQLHNKKDSICNMINILRARYIMKSNRKRIKDKYIFPFIVSDIYDQNTLIQLARKIDGNNSIPCTLSRFSKNIVELINMDTDKSTYFCVELDRTIDVPRLSVSIGKSLNLIKYHIE